MPTQLRGSCEEGGQGVSRAYPPWAPAGYIPVYHSIPSKLAQKVGPWSTYFHKDRDLPDETQVWGKAQEVGGLASISIHKASSWSSSKCRWQSLLCGLVLHPADWYTVIFNIHWKVTWPPKVTLFGKGLHADAINYNGVIKLGGLLIQHEPSLLYHHLEWFGVVSHQKENTKISERTFLC